MAKEDETDRIGTQYRCGTNVSRKGGGSVGVALSHRSGSLVGDRYSSIIGTALYLAEWLPTVREDSLLNQSMISMD